MTQPSSCSMSHRPAPAPRGPSRVGRARHVRWLSPVSVVGIVAAMGCHDLTGSQQLPPGTQDPRTFNTPAGAVGMWTAALQAVETAVPQYIIDAGLLTDELANRSTGARVVDQGHSPDPLDQRILPEPIDASSISPSDLDYNALQSVRGLVSQADGAIVTYDTGAHQRGDPAALRSQLLTWKGYAEILLADLFCSGIPLSTLDFQHDFTYQAGSPTDSVYLDARRALDSAYQLASVHDSTRLQDAALVLLGRVYLALGNYPAAADDVTLVPDGFVYTVPVQWLPSNGSCLNNHSCTAEGNILNAQATVADGEGRNGLPYLSGGDPRASVVVTAQPDPTFNIFVPQTFPVKYKSGFTTAFVPFAVADGIEARLIQAEAQLQPASAPAGPWLATLNALRANVANIVAVTGGQYTAGTPLPPLVDPGASLSGAQAAIARIKLLFQERAYWLFLTGHRQGDLRRMIRNYGRSYGFSQATVYPTGGYSIFGVGNYGTDVTAPIPLAEFNNPKFHGCLNRSA